MCTGKLTCAGESKETDEKVVNDMVVGEETTKHGCMFREQREDGETQIAAKGGVENRSCVLLWRE